MKEYRKYWEIDLVPLLGLPCATRCSAETTLDFVIQTRVMSRATRGAEERDWRFVSSLIIRNINLLELDSGLARVYAGLALF